VGEEDHKLCNIDPEIPPQSPHPLLLSNKPDLGYEILAIKALFSAISLPPSGLETFRKPVLKGSFPSHQAHSVVFCSVTGMKTVRERVLKVYLKEIFWSKLDLPDKLTWSPLISDQNQFLI
jgi:hypothetical protein